jgi:hypothetical protein
MHHAQHWVLRYLGRSYTHQLWFAIGQQFGQQFFNRAFCPYFIISFSIGQRFWAKFFKFPINAKRPIRYTLYYDQVYPFC